MHTTVTTDDAELAEQMQAIDDSLRKSFAALPVDDVVGEVQRSLSEVGIDLPEPAVRGYARAIADRADHELVLP